MKSSKTPSHCKFRVQHGRSRYSQKLEFLSHSRLIYKCLR